MHMSGGTNPTESPAQHPAKVNRAPFKDHRSAQTRLSRFTGASAISSADFYDEEEEGSGRGGRGGGGRGGGANNFDIDNMNASELVGRLSIQVISYLVTTITRVSNMQFFPDHTLNTFVGHCLGELWDLDLDYSLHPPPLLLLSALPKHIGMHAWVPSGPLKGFRVVECCRQIHCPDVVFCT